MNERTEYSMKTKFEERMDMQTMFWQGWAAGFFTAVGIVTLTILYFEMT